LRQADHHDEPEAAGRDRSAPLHERLKINVKAALKIKLLH
jgi:hypothetical protein